MSNSADDPRLGTLLGSYRLRGILGDGGMGRVYLAEHTKLGRQVAIKLLHPEYARDATAVKRFFGEARAVNQIHHENIVEITDFVEDDAEKYFIMELLEGADLAQSYRHDGILPLRRTVYIARQIAHALAAVHRAGIVHRDLKPENIILVSHRGRRDFVKIVDFGVAKLMELERESLARTKAGSLIGTPMYMSPEQLASKPADYRSDIYALGVLMYEMVTSRRPYDATSVGELVIKQMTETITPPSRQKGVPYKVPPALDAVILDCLKAEADERPQTMMQVSERLAEIAAEIGERRSGRRGRSRKPRRPRVALLGTLLLASAVGALAYQYPEETEALRTRAQEVFKSRRYSAEALRAYDQGVLLLREDSPAAYVEAETAFRRAASLSEQPFERAIAGIAEALALQDLEEGKPDRRKDIARYATQAGAAGHRARAYYELLRGDHAAADVALVQALSTQRNDAVAYTARAMIYLDAGNREAEALGALRTALSIDPAQPRANYLLGRMLADKGKVEEAKPFATRAMAASSRNPRAESLLKLIHDAPIH